MVGHAVAHAAQAAAVLQAQQQRQQSAAAAAVQLAVAAAGQPPPAAHGGSQPSSGSTGAPSSFRAGSIMTGISCFFSKWLNEIQLSINNIPNSWEQ